MADNDALHSRHGNEKPRAGAGSCCSGSDAQDNAQGVHQERDHQHPHHARQQHGYEHGGSGNRNDAEHRVKDLVCGMWVDPHTAKHRAEHNGQPYYFCSAGCREKF
ncbi:MAG: heavy metal translocating P-type ATPase, partial [Microvirga sp.]|nr:heavy metal translocating P-type ATPase [Microvirga sp.]